MPNTNTNKFALKILKLENLNSLPAIVYMIYTEQRSYGFLVAFTCLFDAVCSYKVQAGVLKPNKAIWVTLKFLTLFSIRRTFSCIFENNLVYIMKKIIYYFSPNNCNNCFSSVQTK